MDPSYVHIWRLEPSSISVRAHAYFQATVFESMLFLFVVYKGITSISARIRLNRRLSLVAVLIQENTLYFFRFADFARILSSLAHELLFQRCFYTYI